MEKIRKIPTRLLLSALVILGVAVLAAAGIWKLSSLRKKAEPEVITESTLRQIIRVSDLSTFEAIYNGVTELTNESNPDSIDCYVSYKAKVKAGIDFEKVTLAVDHEAKKIHVVLPEVEITEVNVDIASLDYIFQNDSANVSSISERAYKACIEDVTKESSTEEAIYELAGQNAQNVMKALIHPFVQQLDEEYELIVE